MPPATTQDAQDAIIEEFSQLDDWLDKYEHIVQLGKEFDQPDESFRSDEHALHGCQSQVWISTQEKDGRIYFTGDSDSAIIRGILALLLRTLNGRSADEIASTDLYFMDEIGLSTHLSPARANGVALIVQRLRQAGQPEQN